MQAPSSGTVGIFVRTDANDSLSRNLKIITSNNKLSEACLSINADCNKSAAGSDSRDSAQQKNVLEYKVSSGFQRDGDQPLVALIWKLM